MSGKVKTQNFKNQNLAESKSLKPKTALKLNTKTSELITGLHIMRNFN